MNIHIFIDAENVPVAKAIDAYEFMREEHNVYLCDVIAKETTISPAYKNRRSKNFRIKNCSFGKNSADLWLTVCIARAIFEEPEVELFVIFSSDRDFAPVIQLAVEKQRQVLLLVVESQFKNMNAYLNKMKVDRDYVTLGTLEIEPSLITIKANHLPTGLKEYYLKRYKGSSIFARHGEQFYELPFIDGMNLGQFTQLMRYYKIWPKNRKASKSINELGLSIKDNRVWFQTEDEMMKEIIK